MDLARCLSGGLVLRLVDVGLLLPVVLAAVAGLVRANDRSRLAGALLILA